MSRRARAARLLIALFALFALRLLWVASRVVRVAARDEATAEGSADAIVVLGAAVGRDGSPSAVLAARLDHGIALHQREIAPLLVLTGGFGEGARVSESEAGRRYAIAKGVPEQDIAIEEISRTTMQNLAEAARIVKARGGARIALVSDPYHLYRAEQMALDLGLAVATTPTPYTRYRSAKTKIPFLLREIYFVHHYALTGR